MHEIKFESSNELIIDKHFLDGLEDYGTFYIIITVMKK